MLPLTGQRVFKNGSRTMAPALLVPGQFNHRILINPIEHIWDLAYADQQQLPLNMSELWQCLKTAWNNVPQERTQTVVDSMMKRVNNVIDARGGHTKD